jgi:predicted nuclease of restriction endonuclease-like RecB superfamily
LLKVEHLCLTAREGARATPRYLTARDEVWMRAVIEAFDGYVGRTVAERDAVIPATVRRIARAHGVAARVADGVVHVLCRRSKATVTSAVEPAEARRVAFEEGARDEVFDREACLRRAAERLSTTTLLLEQSLFADRPGARRLSAPTSALSPLEAVELYNLALVQGLLLRSERVIVEVREHVRAVVRFAKLTGLLCTCRAGDRGTRLEISGPLSILRHTTKYGFALASFFPAVLSTTEFRLEALCVLRGEPKHVAIEASDRIARTHKLPRDADSAVERALARDVRRIGGPWSLEREADAIVVGGRIFFPDFTLRRDGAVVLVEIVGFYTSEYLRSKLDVLRHARDRPMIVCIDESLACGDGDAPGLVLRFKRRVDAFALLRAADSLVEAGARPERSVGGAVAPSGELPRERKLGQP